MSYRSLKDKLRLEMLEKRRAERQRRDEILKLNSEEYGDELPDEEEVLEEFEADEEDFDEESGETESEPEENDVIIKDKKSRKNLFVDDEAEESDDDGKMEEFDEDEDNENKADNDKDEDDDESLHLAQEEEEEDENDSGPENKSAIKKLKTNYRKIRAADLLSEDSNSNTSSQLQMPVARTPLAAEDATPLGEATGGCSSLQFSSLSSGSSLMNTELRWTPFTERQDSIAVSGQGEARRTPSGGGGARESESPTSSQLARKRLGFEGICV
jgi:hypothetical protein